MKQLFLFALLNTALQAQIIMNPAGASVASPSTNGVAFWDGTKLTTSATGGAGTLCLVSTAGAAPVFAACSGSAATAWSSLTNPSGNVAIAVGNNTTTFTASTATTAPFVFQDTTGNTSVLPLVRISTVGTSTALPIKITAQGTTAGVQMSAAGVLAAIGTGSVSADQVNLAVVPTSAVVVGSNGSKQLVAATTSGSGSTVALTTSPVFVTPTLGAATATTLNKLTITTPATGSTLTIADGKTLTASNTLTFTGTDASSVAFGTGGTVAYTANNLGVFASTTSAQLRGIISDESGTGAALFAGGALGAATATTINKVTITTPATGSTLTIADGKTLTASNTLTFTGTDGSSVAFGAGGTVVYTGSSNSWTAGTQSFASAAHSLPAKTGTIGNIPATCTFGEVYFSTSAAAGNNLYLCTDNVNTWTAVLGTGGTGNVVGPGSSTSGHFATYGDSTGKLLVDTLSLVTTVGNPGLDTSVPTEKAVRAAITGAVAGVASIGGQTGAITLTTPIHLTGSAIDCPTCVTSAAALTNNQLVFGAGSQATAVGDLTGDVTTAGGKTTTLGNIPTAVTMAGYLAATAIAAPATPAAGIGRIYVDSTSKNLAVKDDAGVIKHGIQTNTGTANQFATAVSDAGVITLAQPTILNLATFTSANLATQLTDETGSGAAVFATSPTLVTPTLGAATATTINKVTITTPATGSTLTIADGKTLTASNTLTFTGTDTSSVAFGGGGTVAYTANNLSVFASTTSAQLRGVLSDESGTGAALFANGNIGTATMTSLNKVAFTAPTTAATLIFGTDNASLTFQGTGTVVNRDSTDTLTNKSIDAGQLTGTIAAGRMPALTGDITTSAGSVATTLATVNSNVGSFGDSLHVGAFTVNGKGLITAASSVAIPGGYPGTVVSVTETANTATFDCGNKNTVVTFTITLTANFTSAGTLQNCPAGTELVFAVNVGTGVGSPFTITFPTGFSGAGTPIPQSGVTTTQAFFWDGTNANPIGGATASTGFGQLSEVAAPSGNPAANSEFFWADSTAHMPQSKDNSGNINSMVRTSAGPGVSCGASCTEYVAYLSSSGVLQSRQVAFTDISGVFVEAQAPSATVFTDRANTYGAFLSDFTSATLKIPNSAGFAAGASSMLGYDTTAKNLLGLANGVNAYIMTTPVSATPTSGRCVEWVVTAGFVGLTTAASNAACGSGGAGTVTHTLGSLTSGALILGNGGADIKLGDLSGDCSTSGAAAVTCTQINGSNFTVNTSGVPTKVSGITTAGNGLIPIIGTPSTLSNSSATGSVTLATAPGAGDYEIHYNLDLHTACTTGTGALHLAFGWTGNAARTLATGTWALTPTQGASIPASGILPIHVVSGNITYQPVLDTACGTGTATWDGQVYVVRSN